MIRPRRNYASLFLAAFAIVLSFSINAVAKSNPNFSNIKIKNFGQMDERFYRGARPKEEDLKALAALGVKTVIDLSRERF